MTFEQNFCKPSDTVYLSSIKQNDDTDTTAPFKGYVREAKK